MCALSYKPAIMALGIALLSSGQTAAAQASIWSADSGPSLFQTLGIETSSPQARSHNLPRLHTDFQIMVSTAKEITNTRLTTLVSTRIPIPAAESVMSSPTKAQFQTVGAKSASIPSPKFMPLNKEDSVEVEPMPLQMAQVAPQTAPRVPVTAIDAHTQKQVDDWHIILEDYLSESTDGLARFDYGALAASSRDMALLDKYILTQAGKNPSTMSRNEAMAYWANLYNALTVQVVAENYPVRSIREIKSGLRKGPWKRKLVTVEGRTLSLDNIEHDIMRPTFKTPLVHYMVNCASIGCPNLKATPWRAATLNADLDAAARAYINSPRGVHISNGKIKASSIYKWFKKDFGGKEKGVLAHLIKYAEPDLAVKLQGRKKVDNYAYDWGVNAP